MLHALRQAVVRIGYRLLRAVWWVRRPVILGVRVLLVRDGRVLLVQHSYRPEWFLPGGRPDRGETLAETARREAREEVGARVDDVQLMGAYSNFNEGISDHVVVFSAERFERNEVQSKEIRDVQWFDLNQLPADAATETRCVLDNWRPEEAGWYRVV